MSSKAYRRFSRFAPRLELGLVIYHIDNGDWFFGPPTLEDLRHDISVVTKKSRPEWDVTTPALKSAWQQDRKDHRVG